MRRLLLAGLACLTLCGCGRMYEQGGLFTWPDGTCLWPCIGGGGGGSTSYITGITFPMGNGWTYSMYTVD